MYSATTDRCGFHLQKAPTSGDDSNSKPFAWIVNPTIDLLFCCGGIVWILFAIHYFCLGSSTVSHAAKQLIMLSALATIFLGQSHVIATLVRVYNDDGCRRKYSLCTEWAALACGALALLGCFVPGLSAIFAKVYLLIVSQHFTAQTYGIVLLYCGKRNYFMNVWEKRLLSSVMQATMWFAVLRQLTYRSWSGDTFLGQKLPFWGPLPEWIFITCTVVLALAVAAFAGAILRKAFVERKFFPLPALLTTGTGVLIFVLGKDMTGILWFYAPAFFHGSQYLAVTTACSLKEQGLPEGVTTHQIASQLKESKAFRYIGFLVIAGICLFTGVPRILEQFGFDFATASASIFTTVQFHHVITDHFIWRLKDPALRRALIR